MKRYAYSHVRLGDDSEAEAQLNLLGEQGWRVVEFWVEGNDWYAWLERASESGDYETLRMRGPG